jgi:protocatechuate 3,4-dioxygenase, beta subunit
MPSRALAVMLVLSAAACAQASSKPCATAGSSAVLVGENEPGERLVVSGTVLQPDGVTPAPGVVLYVYQTDAGGLYSPQRGVPPRIRGWLRTDAEGRYRFTTIVPGAYPNRTVPAHIHLHLWDGGFEPQWTQDILFAADPLVTAAQRTRSQDLGRFAFVKSPVRDGSGTQAATHDIRLKARGDRPWDTSAQHGLRACGLRV